MLSRMSTSGWLMKTVTQNASCIQVFKEYFAVDLIAGDLGIPQSPENCIISSESLGRSKEPRRLGTAQTSQFTLLFADEP